MASRCGKSMAFSTSNDNETLEKQNRNPESYKIRTALNTHRSKYAIRKLKENKQITMEELIKLIKMMILILHLNI